ncbi:MAG: hypothetical protein SNJ64_05055 [Endomicrobiia bacterium]
MKKVILFFVSLPMVLFGYTKIYLDTDFRTNYVDYYNLDFELTSSSKSIDNYAFVYSWIDIALKTHIKGIDNIEVCTKLTSIGRWGSGNNYQVENSSLVSIVPTYWWEKTLPYPNTNFNPFLSELYTKYTFFIKNPFTKLNKYFEEVPISITLGRQELEFVDGVVVGKNGIGLDSIKLSFSLEKYFYLETFMSRILNEIVSVNNRNYFLYGTVYGTKYQDMYDFGISNVVEQNGFIEDKKIFTEYFIKHQKNGLSYVFEYVTQTGQKGKSVEYTGSLYYFRTGLEGEGKVLGKSNVDVIWLLSSGGDEGKVFSPAFGKFYNGLEPAGFGDFASGNVKNLFFNLPAGYSGMFVLGMKLKVNPIKNFFPGFNYFLYASPEGTADKPEPSATEKTLGAKKALGIEYGITSEYVVSNYIKLNFEWLVFQPTKKAFNETGDPAYKLKFGSLVKF